MYFIPYRKLEASVLWKNCITQTQLQKLQAGKVSESTLANILKVVCGSAKEKA